MENPTVDEVYHGQGFKIRIINKDDQRNIDISGNYRKSGLIIYEYISEPLGKIGNCKTLKGFYACWGK